MNPGEAATLAVAVNADDTTGLQIKWSGYYSGSGYKDINVTASGTNATTEPLTKACTIYCNVLDRYGNQESCYFNVGIENHLRVSKGDTGAYFADGYAEYVERGQSVPVPLAVSVSADKLQDLKYQWSRYWTDDNGTYRSEMLGTQPKQESGVIDHAWHYSCSVTDCYGNSESTSFTVGIINHLTLVAEETGLDYGTVVTVPLNGSTTLKVVCSADDMTNLRYDWHRYRYDANGKYQSNSNLGNGTTLNTGALDCSWTYTCTARDLHGNTESCSFDVNIENGFRAVTESGDISTSLDLPLNGTKGLTVTATANDMTGMKYQWSKTPYSTLMRYDSSTQIGGATSATLLCDPAEKAMVYRCTVTDRFGTEIECSYYVWVENHLNLRPVTGTASEDDWIVKMNVEKGARATLQVSASADDTAGLR